MYSNDFSVFNTPLTSLLLIPQRGFVSISNGCCYAILQKYCSLNPKTIFILTGSCARDHSYEVQLVQQGKILEPSLVIDFTLHGQFIFSKLSQTIPHLLHQFFTYFGVKSHQSREQYRHFSVNHFFLSVKFSKSSFQKCVPTLIIEILFETLNE